MVGLGDPTPLLRPLKKYSERQKRRWHEQPVLPRSLIKGRGITACRMIPEHRQMILGMELHQGNTTRSSTHGIMLTESDSETGHD
jgi:hypothetical protein